MLTHRFIYTSTAAARSREALREWETEWSCRFRAAGITSLMCLGNGFILHVLEGDRNALSEVFTDIIQDARHHDIEIIDFEPADDRQFPGRALRLVELASPPTPAVRRLLAQFAGARDFRPQRMTPPQSLGFLRGLAEACPQRSRQNRSKPLHRPEPALAGAASR